jgi:cytochrome c oxidase subunit 2
MNGWNAFWPPAASTYATRVDALMWMFTGVVALLAGPVLVLTVWFAIKYRRGRPANRQMGEERDVLIETSWSIIPFVVTIGFFAYAAWLFFTLQRPPANAMTVDVVAKQWMWKFQHPEGQSEIDDLHVPAGIPVRLVMTSQDVIHSLYLPALRIKQDVLPGRYTGLWFKADKPGTYPLRCSQFCGSDHSGMVGNFVVLAPADYAQWLKVSQTDLNLVAQGKALYQKLGCSGCHDGSSTVRAPNLKGLAGSPVQLADGSTVYADRQYLHDSLFLPNKQVTAGYEPRMPTYANLVDEGQASALISYIQSLGMEHAP